jgi:hypothetical protein
VADEFGSSLEGKQVGVSRTQHHGTSNHPGASLSKAQVALHSIGDLFTPSLHRVLVASTDFFGENLRRGLVLMRRRSP